jgi:hypothetical protein
MKRKKEASEGIEEPLFSYPWVDPEEEAVWLAPRVPAEKVLIREGLTIFNVHRT